MDGQTTCLRRARPLSGEQVTTGHRFAMALLVYHHWVRDRPDAGRSRTHA
jgi:hypothetical protein